MDLLANLSTGFGIAFTPINLLFMTIGVTAGTIIGALPGVGPVAGIAILLPLVYGADPVTAMIMMAGIYCGTMYGGTITSVLVGVPGEASTIMTCLDGYEMAKKGRAGPALTISAIGSFFAGTVSVVLLMLAAPPIAKAALSFGPPEYFALMLLGMTAVAGLVGEHKMKGYIVAFFGLMISLIGMDIITGYQRFTFGLLGLADGIKFLPVAVGLFGVAEIFATLEETETGRIIKTTLKEMLITKQDLKDSAAPIGRATIIGFIVGVLPGAGGAVASMLSYATENKLSKHPERFGTREIAAVAGPNAADNASTGGSMIPMLTLGIPGSATTAVMLGALALFNIQPGPLLFVKDHDLVWGLIASMYLANVVLLLMNILFVPVFVSALRIPFAILQPLILVFCFVGVYSTSSSMLDMWVMLVFGVIGYVMKKHDYPPAPLVLALVLGNGLEMSLRQSLMISQGNPGILFARPISGTIMVAVLLVVGWPLIRRLWVRRPRAPRAADPA